MRKEQIIRFLCLGLLFAVFGLAMPHATAAQIGVGVAVSFGPPDIPVYDQPVCPGDGYLWTPGYWAWDPDAGDYFWVPGTWVLAPEPGFLWTPGYWGWGDGGFFFTAGYWGPVVGFYGGINYGFGYFGSGFVGGRWEGGHFFYNRSVFNVNTTVIHNVYDERVTYNNVTRVSYNGGRGGITARPTAAEEAAARERHVGPVPEQTRHIEAARSDPQFRSKVNHGMPAVAATAKPGDFKGSGVVKAREAGAVHNEGEARPGNAGEARPGNAGGGKTPTHPNELPAAERPPAPNTGNPKLDRKYQQQQDKLVQQQQKERQQLQTKQDAEHAKAQKQQSNPARQQQMEQKHQQQTQQLQQKHTQQTQKMVQRQSSSKPAPSHPR